MIRVLPRKNHGENGELRMVNCEFRTQNCADYVLSAAAKTGRRKTQNRERSDLTLYSA